MNKEQKINRVLAGLSHTGYTTEIEKCEARLLIEELTKENEKLIHNWNELKKYIGSEWYCFDNESVEYDVAKDILDKMQELERSEE